MEQTSRQERTGKLSLRTYDSFLRVMGDYADIFWDGNDFAQKHSLGTGLATYTTPVLLKCLVRYRQESGDLDFERLKILLERALKYWKEYEPESWEKNPHSKREINRQRKKFETLAEIVSKSCESYEQNRFSYLDESDRYKRYQENDPFSKLSWAKLLIHYKSRKSREGK